MNEINESFRASIQDTFGNAPLTIEHTGIGDGIQPTRFCTSENGTDLNGWCYFNLYADIPYGVFGCWKQGSKYNWSYGQPLSREQRGALEENRKEAEIKTALAKAEKLERVNKQRRIWRSAEVADTNHLYLERKCVKPYGLKQYRDALLVPLKDINGELLGLQHIRPDGVKRIHGMCSGLFHLIGCVSEPKQTIYIAEGYATAATIHQLTGHPVVIALSTTNLLKVGLVIRKRFREADLVFAADNDIGSKAGVINNPGVHYARLAAKAVYGRVIIPDTQCKADFNDLAVGSM